CTCPCREIRSCCWSSGSSHGRFTARCLFFNDRATTGIYTLSLHDALPICFEVDAQDQQVGRADITVILLQQLEFIARALESLGRSEEHTSELQSRRDLVCRLLLEKKTPQVGQTHPAGHGPGPSRGNRLQPA